MSRSFFQLILRIAGIPHHVDIVGTEDATRNALVSRVLEDFGREGGKGIHNFNPDPVHPAFKTPQDRADSYVCFLTADSRSGSSTRR